MMNEIIKLSEGNPGAFTCLVGLLEKENAFNGIVIIPKIKQLGIIGTHLYVLWSDISNRDYNLMSYLCKNVPDALLVKASFKQDYSGRENLKEYIEKYYN